MFELTDHPTAQLAYAWSDATTGTKRRFFAVLHMPPVDSPMTAVRASILADCLSSPMPRTAPREVGGG